MSAHSGRRSLAALTPSLVPSGRGTEAAMRGMLAALDAVTAVAASQGREARERFLQAVNAARRDPSDSYSRAFCDTAWLAIDELRDAADGTSR